jgi:ribonuclease BN (tRNA processing enzyme)
MGPFVCQEFTVSARATEHAGMPGLIYRLDVGEKRVVITGDTQPDEGRALVDFGRGADLLACECSGTNAFMSNQPWGGWHMTPEAVARLARDAGVRRVVFKHPVIEDWVDDPQIVEKMAQQIRQGYAGEVTAGYDGLRMDLM